MQRRLAPKIYRGAGLLYQNQNQNQNKGKPLWITEVWTPNKIEILIVGCPFFLPSDHCLTASGSTRSTR